MQQNRPKWIIQLYIAIYNVPNKTCELFVPTQSIQRYRELGSTWRVFHTINAITGISIYNDVNEDGEINIADINAIINSILTGNQDLSKDANSDGEVTIADVNSVINAIIAQEL